jgi:hypothetical protein
MIHSGYVTRFVPVRPAAGWARSIGFGFLYWLAFLLVLEPGNLYHAAQAGPFPTWPHEVVRIVCAAMLGTAFSAIPWLLTQHFPVPGKHWRRRIWIHGVSTAVLACMLVLASCLLAAWVFEGIWLPALSDIWPQLADNWLLLVYALLAFTVVAHVRHSIQRKAAAKPVVEPTGFPSRVAVKTRGAVQWVEVTDIAWVETQGNYLALHTATATHLIRATLAKFEPTLDPTRFVRIHRCAIVAIDRVATVEPIENGDGLLHLASGQSLRVSRRYRKDVQARLVVA